MRLNKALSGCTVSRNMHRFCRGGGFRAAAFGLAGVVLLLGFPARAAEVKVVSSGGFAAAYRTLAPEFERQTGDTLVAGWGPSMGTTQDAVPVRLARGEPI